MTSLRNQRLFSFAEFLARFWQPLGDRVKTAAPDTFEQIMVAAEWVETIFWVRFGVELGFYPSSEVNRLMDRWRGDISKLVALHGKILESLIPPSLIVLLRGMLSGLVSFDLLGSLDYDKADLAKSMPYFQSGLGLARRMNEDQLGREFRTHLLLSNQELWHRSLQNPVHFELVRKFVSGELPAADVSLESLIAGFFKTIDAMAMWATLFQTLRTDHDIEIGIRSMIARQLGQITCWRLNLRESSTKARLLQSARIAQDVLKYSVVVSGRSNFEGVTTLPTGVERLIDGWLGDHPYHLTFGAQGA